MIFYYIKQLDFNSSLIFNDLFFFYNTEVSDTVKQVKLPAFNIKSYKTVSTDAQSLIMSLMMRYVVFNR